MTRVCLEYGRREGCVETLAAWGRTNEHLEMTEDGPRGSFHLFLGDPEVVLRDYIKGTALGKINKDLGSEV